MHRLIAEDAINQDPGSVAQYRSGKGEYIITLLCWCKRTYPNCDGEKVIKALAEALDGKETGIQKQPRSGHPG